LGRLTLVTARESSTVDYLSTLGIGERVVPCADPAYVVAPEIQAPGYRRGNAFTIGINLSPLSTCYSKYSLKESVRRQAQVIQCLLRTTGARIVLIPHVVCDFNEEDDDLRYLRRVRQAIAPECQEAVSLLEGDPGFIGTKKQLAACNLVIAARMHCAINALAARVPTILVAYSLKAVGMADYVYGHRDWVIPLDDFPVGELLESKVRSMMGRDVQIRSFLADRIPQVQKDAYSPMQRLRAELENGGQSPIIRRRK
jgi:polysaccharide pyruvyl transferase WcaK-like protein